MEKKTTLNWFVDFDKEEKWLNHMCKQGWAFWHTNGVVYRFKACQPGEFIYQLDFDEKKSGSAEDYVVFRTSCGDTFVNLHKSKIYWKRKAQDGPFEKEDNITAKIQLTNKAFNYHLNSFIGLTLVMAVAYLFLNPLGRYLPDEQIAHFITSFSSGFTYGILAAELVIILPVLRKLRKKNSLIRQLY